MSLESDRHSLAPRLSRRLFLGGVVAGAATVLLAACGGTATETPKPAAGGGTGASAAPAASSAPRASSAAAASAAPATGGQKKNLLFWGRQQFLPESNDYLTESVKMAGDKGNFNVKVELFSNDEHPQKEVVAMESGIVPDITYTYGPALWNQNGYAMEVQDLYDEIGKTGGGWLDLADPASKVGTARIAIPMNNEPWFLHLRKDVFEGAGAKLPLATWDQMMDAFKKVNKPESNFFAYDGQMTEADWGGNCLQFMWAFGGRLFDKEGNPTIDTKENLAGVTAYTDLFKNKMMPPGVVQQLASGNNEAWLSGQVAAVSNPGSIVLSMRKDNKDLLNKTYLQAFPSAVTAGKFNQSGGSATLVINKKSQVIDEAKQVARMILSPERYPTQLEKAGSYWFPIMKNTLTIPFFTNDQWNKQIVENVVPWTLTANADTGLTPILDDISVKATGDMLQAIVVQGKSPQEALKGLADAAAKAKEKFKK
jgi:multiple sugar transport system substrate-binding protein